MLEQEFRQKNPGRRYELNLRRLVEERNLSPNLLQCPSGGTYWIAENGDWLTIHCSIEEHDAYHPEKVKLDLRAH